MLKNKLLPVSLIGNAVLLVLLGVLFFTSRSDDRATGTWDSRPAVTERTVDAERPAPAEPAGTAQTDEGSEPSAPVAPETVTPDCFDHFQDTHPEVRSGEWLYLTDNEESPVWGTGGATVVVIVDSDEVVGAARFEYTAIAQTIINVHDALNSDCEPVEVAQQETEDDELYLSVGIDGTDYRIYLYQNENTRIGMARLQAP